MKKGTSRSTAKGGDKLMKSKKRKKMKRKKKGY